MNRYPCLLWHCSNCFFKSSHETWHNHYDKRDIDSNGRDAGQTRATGCQSATVPVTNKPTLSPLSIKNDVLPLGARSRESRATRVRAVRQSVFRESCGKLIVKLHIRCYCIIIWDRRKFWGMYSLDIHEHGRLVCICMKYAMLYTRRGKSVNFSNLADFHVKFTVSAVAPACFLRCGISHVRIHSHVNHA